jgi:4-amino-4-deoxy-L-arabinose transferase-like glycosyltransferase
MAAKNKKKSAKKRKTESSSTFPRFSWFENYTYLIIIVLTLIAFGLRVHRVGYLSFWFDELIHINNVRNFLVNGESLFTESINGIFLTFVITPLYKIFGMTEFWGRLPSVIFGTLTIPATYSLGKQLLNKYVGFFTALFLTFSLYDVFWSRMARMYSSFGFFFILLLITFYHAFETKPVKEKYLSFYRKYGLHKKYLIAFPVVFILSFFNHQLTYFFIFGAGLYATTIAVYRIYHQYPNRFNNKYAWVGYPSVLVGVFGFVPFLNDLLRPLLKIFVSERMINKAMPQWDFILNKLSNPEERFKIFFKYGDVLYTDFSILCFFAIAGLGVAFFLRRKSGLFLFSFSAFLFLLMSFIFRDPSLPRYLLYIYPLLLMSVAVVIYAVMKYGIAYVLPQKILTNRLIKLLLLAGIIRILFFDFPTQGIKDLITTRSHGLVVPQSLSKWTFSNWRFASNYVDQRNKPGDIHIATVPTAVKFYLNIDNCLMFRQRKYDAKKRQWVYKDPPPDEKYHAFTLQGFVNTVKDHQRGWLLADYYLHNAVTDPRTRQWIYQNLRYHYYANNDGTVEVYSWDHSTPKPPKKSFVVDVGKSGKLDASRELPLQIPNYNKAQGYRFILTAQNIDAKEALIVVNKNNGKYLPQTQSRKREQITVQIPKKWLNPQNNKIQFQFRKENVENPRYFEPGFAIYDLKVEPL